jgi:hypothetical protein
MTHIQLNASRGEQAGGKKNLLSSETVVMLN